MNAKLPVDINVSDLSEEGSMDIVDTMTDIMKLQQQGAMELLI